MRHSGGTASRRTVDRAGPVARLAGAAVLALAVVACGESATEPERQTDYFGPATAPDVRALLAGLDMETALARISAADMARHIGALAHDSMMGRRTGARELESAAAYVAGALAAAGVEPAGAAAADGAGPDPDAGAYLVRWRFAPSYPLLWADSLARRPPNVVGVVRGSDPALADRYVVVTAHFDHIGTGPAVDGDSIFNGADDNASGTAALLEVAEALAALPVPPPRSVLFLAVSGEELGLLGSAAYLAEPTVPVTAMVADINLDMVSRGLPDAAFAVGYQLSTLGLLARAISEQVPLGIAAEIEEYTGQDLIERSDHFSFARRRVPALGLFGGLHPDYHTRDDEPDRVDADKAAAVARLATWLVAAVATMDEPPTWTDFGTAYMARHW